MRFLLLGINVLVAAGFLLGAYSPYISPSAHPVLACSGLAFPVFIVLNAVFLLLWLFVKWRVALFPLLVFVAGWGSLSTYFPINSSKTPQEGRTIKLLSYNTEGMSDSVIAYLQKSDADIICLQEFPAKDTRWLKNLDKKLSAYPYKVRTFFHGSNGMACYSRFPILSSRPIDYESAVNGSTLYQLKWGKDTLFVINNHLETNKLNSDDKAMYNQMLTAPDQKNVKKGGKHLLHKLADAVTIRAAQADSVAKAIASCASPYILVCGDFNDSPISYAHHTIGKGLTDAFADAGNGVGITYYRSHLYFRIDHIFAGKAFRVLQCEVDRSIHASDHYPIWCRVETFK